MQVLSFHGADFVVSVVYASFDDVVFKFILNSRDVGLEMSLQFRRAIFELRIEVFKVD